MIKAMAVVFIFIFAPALVSAPQAQGTMALCFNCGELHPGPVSPCPKCGFKPDMDNFALWTTFSEHFMTRAALEHFGQVTKTIAGKSDNFEERMWVFLSYVVEKYPNDSFIDSKSLEIPAQFKDSVPGILKELDIPTVPIQKSK
jgi:hypothetical protein